VSEFVVCTGLLLKFVNNAHAELERLCYCDSALTVVFHLQTCIYETDCNLDGEPMGNPQSPRYKTKASKAAAAAANEAAVQRAQAHKLANTTSSSTNSGSSSVRLSTSDKDKLIACMQAELKALRDGRTTPVKSDPLVSPDQAALNRSSFSRSSVGSSSGRVTPQSQQQQQQQQQRRQSTSAGGASTRANTAVGSAVATALEVRDAVSRSGSGSGIERLILRSSCGQPRVVLSASERRASREYNDAVTSVRGLA
jgi:hypothetical protein